jgi:signal peptidase complex subunit 3
MKSVAKESSRDEVSDFSHHLQGIAAHTHAHTHTPTPNHAHRLIRLNAVVFFSFSVLLTLALLTSLTSTPLFLGPNGNPSSPLQPIVSHVELAEMRSLRSHGGVDRALFSFNLKADFAPAFHWNVKQLFVFVCAEFSTPSNPVNEIVLWDKIIEASDPVKKVHEKNSVIKYPLSDQYDELRGKEVTLKVYYDTMPLTVSARARRRVWGSGGGREEGGGGWGEGGAGGGREGPGVGGPGGGTASVPAPRLSRTDPIPIHPPPVHARSRRRRCTWASRTWWASSRCRRST